MKFNYLATILMGTVALASNFNAGPANAIDCTNTRIISVPWKWEASLRGNFGDWVHTPVEPSQPGAEATTIKVVDYIIDLVFDKPTDVCEELGKPPTETSFALTSTFSGQLSSNPPLKNQQDSPYVLMSINFGENRSTNFGKQVLEVGLGEKQFNVGVSDLFTVTNGMKIPVEMVSEIYEYTNGAHVTSASGFLSIKNIFPFPGETEGTVEYKVPVQGAPEPLTMLASATAVGFGAFFKRQHSKNQKKS